ncbi:hypothetical protein [Candidatus Tisiphia endosymbiont of Hybos culiciformis]|uniref:hypothetical protein n=1 Tax=Candidatus Tisiphia endosymbiont of Hybos culiciformis TaxID=3139331 RepID=UPI003CCAAAE9
MFKANFVRGYLFYARLSQSSTPQVTLLQLFISHSQDIRFYEELSKQLPENSRVFADKAYQTGNQPVADQGGITLYTPVKKAKGQELLDAADRLLSSAISSVRQPIESLFNWIEEKTNIQIASKVRSYNGLMVHVFGKISVALFMMQTRFCS